jgi:hypothetical protein
MMFQRDSEVTQSKVREPMSRRPRPISLNPVCLKVIERYFTALFEGGRSLGMAIKERLPAQVETVADLLKCLAVERQPILAV